MLASSQARCWADVRRAKRIAASLNGSGAELGRPVYQSMDTQSL